MEVLAQWIMSLATGRGRRDLAPSCKRPHTLCYLDVFQTAPLLAQTGVADPLTPSLTQQTASSPA